MKELIPIANSKFQKNPNKYTNMLFLIFSFHSILPKGVKEFF